MKVAQFINMILFTLVTGVFWGTWFSLSRSIGSITPGTFIEVGHTMIGNLGGPMSVLMPATVASAVVLMVLLYRARRRTALAFTTAALLLLLVSLAITLSVNVPIDNHIRAWTAETLPADWEAKRDRWEFYHALRTFVSIAAVACLFAGALSADDRRRSGREVSTRAA